MELIKLYFKILGSLLWAPLHHEDPPVPDDGPPDGSLRFIEYGDISWKTIPHTYQNFEFSPNDDEYDQRISWLSMEIMERFCGSRKVLTLFSFGQAAILTP